jgi:hypothetical protein
MCAFFRTGLAAPQLMQRQQAQLKLSALDDADQYHDHRNHEQYVYESTDAGGRHHAKCPQNNQNDRNSFQHNQAPLRMTNRGPCCCSIRQRVCTQAHSAATRNKHVSQTFMFMSALAYRTHFGSALSFTPLNPLCLFARYLVLPLPVPRVSGSATYPLASNSCQRIFLSRAEAAQSGDTQ